MRRRRSPTRWGLRFVVILALALLGTAAGSCRPADVDASAPFASALARLEPDVAAVAAIRLSTDARTVLRALDVGGPEAGESPSAEAGASAGYAVESVNAAERLYGRRPPLGEEGADVPSSAALAAWANDVGRRIDPQALLITDGDDPSRTAFAAVHWPSPLVPRLRVVRLPPDLRDASDREAILDVLGTCAVEVDEWISAPEEVVLRFLREEVASSMLVAARDPVSGEPVEAWIGADRVVEALRFEHPATAELAGFSAWFAGTGPGPLAVTRLLPHLRSSLGPRDLLALFRSLR